MQREPAVVVGVDQLVRRGRDRGEDPQPRERVLAVVLAKDSGRDRITRHAVEPIAPGDEVTGQFGGIAVFPVADDGARGVDRGRRDIAHVEPDHSPRRKPRGDEVLHHLLLAVDPDRATGEIGERDPVPSTVEPELDPAVDQRLAIESIAEPRLAQELDRRLLEHARP